MILHILCLDTGPSMDTAPLEEGETWLETAVDTARRTVRQKTRPSRNCPPRQDLHATARQDKTLHATARQDKTFTQLPASKTLRNCPPRPSRTPPIQLPASKTFTQLPVAVVGSNTVSRSLGTFSERVWVSASVWRGGPTNHVYRCE